ncbi:MAG: M14 family zinc carboxypeptidase, partial [Flavobacteriaceae bacterium]
MYIQRIALIISVIITSVVNAQDLGFAQKLYSNHEQYKVNGLESRRIKHNEVLINNDRVKAENPDFYSVQTVGRSIEGRQIQMISFGKGSTDVLLWSQMHGNESTATRALFDLLNYFSLNQQSNEVSRILSELSIHVIPMLNPD